MHPISKSFKFILQICILLLVCISLKAQPSATTARVDLPKLNDQDLAALLAGKKGAYMLVSNPGLQMQDHALVQAVALDVNQRPISRTPTALSCVRISLSQLTLKPEDAKILCFSNKKDGLNKNGFSLPTEFLFSPKLALLSDTKVKIGIGKPPVINRARISRDGKYTASTVFTFGSSYSLSGGGFSTETRIGKTDGSMPPDNIEKWRVSLNNVPITAQDLNLWGVTFDPSDTDRFLVTVSTNGKPRLATGSVSRKEIRIINNTSNIECPSFSPDGKKIAFKRRLSTHGQWSPAVLDLATAVETVFTVAHNVDDQIEWLNNNTLIYEAQYSGSLGQTSIGLMNLDIRSTTNKPQLFLQDARSPTFFRP